MENDATHIFPLVLAIKTFGPMVLEVGCGWYSTPIVHAMSHQSITIENDPEWHGRLQRIAPDRILCVPNVVSAANKLATERKFNVVFIDCYNGEDRVSVAKLFLDFKCCIVAHDTERSYWNSILSIAKFHKRFDLFVPNTSWISNVLDFTLA